MHMQRRSHQEQQRLISAQFSPGKISKALELAASMMPGNSRPVIQSLQRQMNVFIGVEFDYRKASVSREGEHVNHGAVCRGERRHLRIETTRVQSLVHRCDVAND